MAVKITKVINTTNVLKTIWNNQGISRIDIAKKLKLDKSTVTVIVNNLIDNKYVSEVEEGEAGPKGGRKPVKLKINKLFGSVAGIEMHPNFYQAVLIDLGGDVITSVYKKVTINQDNFLDYYKEIINDLCSSEEEIPPLLGVGIGTTGIVDPNTGTILQSIPLNVENFPIQTMIEEKEVFPVSVENDANACCWGEMVFHRATPLKNFLFVLVEFHGSGAINSESTHGISVGLGFVFNEKLHYGQNHSAGEFRSIEWTNRNVSQFSINDEDTYRIEEDDKVFDKFTQELSNHLAFLVNTLNLNHIFLGGDIERHKERFTPVLKKTIQTNWPYKDFDKCTIHYSSFGKSAVAYGAAGMMLNRLFVDRELIHSLYK
ncbi:MAG: ROK family transcriptional regulator [Spirochaetaceae bacterium]|jgi:predicted NBD/HSP70 family sugar kinase|nr:ROK family transcriptional regulator [Spirochaetaceae bacterium]